MRLLSILALIAACASPQNRPRDTEPAQAGEERIPERIVAMRAIADVSRISPSQELSVAAALEIEPGWHIYWQFPGETGKATEARIEGPETFAIGEVRFPGPERIELGARSAFGYQGRAMLSASVTAPESIPDRARFQVSARWLACKGEICVPGSSSAEVTLRRADASSPSAPANQALFQDHLARLPQPLNNLANARHDWLIHEGSTELVMYVDGGARVEFFPTAELAPQLTGQAMVPGQGVGALHLSFRGAGPERVSGVMLAADGQTTHYFELDLPGPRATTASN